VPQCLFDAHPPPVDLVAGRHQPLGQVPARPVGAVELGEVHVAAGALAPGLGLGVGVGGWGVGVEGRGWVGVSQGEG